MKKIIYLMALVMLCFSISSLAYLDSFTEPMNSTVNTSVWYVNNEDNFLDGTGRGYWTLNTSNSSIGMVAFRTVDTIELKDFNYSINIEIVKQNFSDGGIDAGIGLYNNETYENDFYCSLANATGLGSLFMGSNSSSGLPVVYESISDFNGTIKLIYNNATKNITCTYKDKTISYYANISSNYIISGFHNLFVMEEGEIIGLNEARFNNFSFSTPGEPPIPPNVPPPVPNITSPANNTIIEGLSGTMTWTAVEDPEGDNVTYRFYANGINRENLTSNIYNYNADEYGIYIVQVSACDSTNCSSLSPAFTYTLAKNLMTSTEKLLLGISIIAGIFFTIYNVFSGGSIATIIVTIIGLLIAIVALQLIH